MTGIPLHDHVDTITDLLLGAAYADKRLEGREVEAIRALLRKLIAQDELPAALDRRITGFNPARFDEGAAASSMLALDPTDKRKVLDLVATINEADDVLDLDEDAYLRKVARGLGVGDEEYVGLEIEVLEDDDLEGMLA